MAKKENTKKEKRNKTLEGRKKIVIPIFKDEFDKFELTEDMTNFDAQTQIRDLLKLPRRQRASVSPKATLRNRLKDMSSEEVEKILKELDN